MPSVSYKHLCTDLGPIVRLKQFLSLPDFPFDVVEESSTASGGVYTLTTLNNSYTLSFGLVSNLGQPAIAFEINEVSQDPFFDEFPPFKILVTERELSIHAYYTSDGFNLVFTFPASDSAPEGFMLWDIGAHSFLWGSRENLEERSKVLVDAGGGWLMSQADFQVPSTHDGGADIDALRHLQPVNVVNDFVGSTPQDSFNLLVPTSVALMSTGEMGTVEYYQPDSTSQEFVKIPMREAGGTFGGPDLDYSNKHLWLRVV